jgi:formylglycine-generating enzyme required for sulfatase activity
MRYTLNLLICILFLGFIFQCKQDKNPNIKVSGVEKTEVRLASVVKNISQLIKEKPEEITTPKGMVWIPGGVITQGAVLHDEMAMSHEKPAHKVAVDGFFMDITEVTNANFKKFVDATGYETVAEKAIDWEEMKKQLPEGTPKPHDSIMQPGSLIFKKTKNPVSNLYDFSQWWNWSIGANWKHPECAESAIN